MFHRSSKIRPIGLKYVLLISSYVSLHVLHLGSRHSGPVECHRQLGILQDIEKPVSERMYRNWGIKVLL